MPNDTSGSLMSAEDFSQPQTPPAASVAEVTSTDITSDNSTGGKRKQQGRTAQLRATHSAVERQRRANLNGRFHCLAGILPNLFPSRRPSKLAIVNSSIAYFHASRRHRLLAAREVRLLKLEVDALRLEVNNWWDRAAIHRVQEPTRGEGFSTILSGELEILPVDGTEDEDGEEGDKDLHTPGTGIPPDENFENPFDISSSGLLRNSYRNDSPHPQGYSAGYFIHEQLCPMPMLASPCGIAVENPGILCQAMGGISYPSYPEMDQGRENDGDNRRMSPRGRASPPGTPLHYFEQGWNGINHSDMAGNAGMGNRGVPSQMMM